MVTAHNDAGCANRDVRSFLPIQGTSDVRKADPRLSGTPIITSRSTPVCLPALNVMRILFATLQHPSDAVSDPSKLRMKARGSANTTLHLSCSNALPFCLARFITHRRRPQHVPT
jgi:hypothetical protein